MGIVQIRSEDLVLLDTPGIDKVWPVDKLLRVAHLDELKRHKLGAALRLFVNDTTLFVLQIDDYDAYWSEPRLKLLHLLLVG